MKLRNGFSNDTRLLYLYHHSCFLCGSNGWDRGGLEIHHILGRVSDVPFNSSCLCGKCHSGISHNREEHQKIFAETLHFLKKQKYQPTDADWKFLEEHFEELLGPEAADIINRL